MSSRYTGQPSKQEALSTGEEEEFKVVDMSGNTVVKRMAQVAPSIAAQNAAESGGSSAGDLLDEILSGGSSAPEGLSAEELQRLETVKVNQEKSSKILRALLELLLEKGELSQKELAARIRS